MAAAIPVKGKPGVFYIPSLGQQFKAQELTEDSFFDSVFQAAGTIALGTKLQFFDAAQTKNFQHTNITTVRRIPAQVEFSLTRLGVQIAQAVGNSLVTDADILKVGYTGALYFGLSKQQIAQGPLWKYPGGYGMVGQTNRSGTGVVNNGVGSPGAVPPLVVNQPVSEKDDLNGYVRYDDATWITGYVGPVTDGITVLTLNLHGIQKIAVSR